MIGGPVVSTAASTRRSTTIKRSSTPPAAPPSAAAGGRTASSPQAGEQVLLLRDDGDLPSPPKYCGGKAPPTTTTPPCYSRLSVLEKKKTRHRRTAAGGGSSHRQLSLILFHQHTLQRVKWAAILIVLFLFQNVHLHYWPAKGAGDRTSTTIQRAAASDHDRINPPRSSYYYPEQQQQPPPDADKNDPTTLLGAAAVPPFTATAAANHLLLGCEEIAKLTMGRKLGEGRHKIAYEITLPDGTSAVAKRCKSEQCIVYERLRLEAEKNLSYHAKGVVGVVAIHGVCYRPYRTTAAATTTDTNSRGIMNLRLSSSSSLRHHDRTDVSVGHTVIYEAGEVLMKNWGEMVRHDCFASFFTETDVEDLRTLARSYSAAKIIVRDLDGVHATDNDYPTQYIMTKQGIRHTDLDRTYDCDAVAVQQQQSDGGTNSGGDSDSCPGMTAEELLEINCRILVGGVAKVDRPDCSESYYSRRRRQQQQQQHVVSTDPPTAQRIDIAAARRHCHMDFFGFWLKHWLS